MPSAELVGYSNLALYSAMAVFTVSMLIFAAYLAALGPVAAERGSKRRSRELVAAGNASVGTPTAGSVSARTPADAPPPADAVQAEGVPASDPPVGEPSARARKTGNIALYLAWLGTLLLVASVVMRGLAVMRPPWGNMFEFATAGAAAASLAYCLLARRRHWEWLGLFVIGPILLTLGLAMFAFYTEAAELMPALKSVWLVIHVVVAILAVAVFTIGFSMGIVYLVKRRREEHPPARRNFVETLPPGASLERAAYGLNMVGFILWTFTLVAGAIWAQKAWSAYWTWDPKEVWTFVIWVVYAAYMHARATAGWEPRKAMWIALAGYVCVLLNFTVVNLFFSGMHSYSGLK